MNFSHGENQHNYIAKETDMSKVSPDIEGNASSPRHHVARILILVAAVVCFAINGFFSSLASGFGVKLGILLNSTGDISDKFSLQITPSGPTFSIWGVIYVYELLFCVYVLSLICRRGPGGGYLYYDPDFLPPLLYIVYCVNMALNTAWLFVWDRQHINVAFVLLALTAFTLYICIFLSMRGLKQHGDVLATSGHMLEVRLVRYVVQNGLAVYATWTTIATLLNFAIVLTYSAGVDNDVSSTVALSVLAAEILVWFTMDLTVLDRHTRYLFTPYAVVPGALLGSLLGNWNWPTRNTVFTLVLLIVSGVAGLIKVMVALIRWRKDPIFRSGEKV